ncbi:hypothetical protein ACOSP7_001663 [Xanthoceras sorbifolium]
MHNQSERSTMHHNALKFCLIKSSRFIRDANQYLKKNKFNMYYGRLISAPPRKCKDTRLQQSLSPRQENKQALSAIVFPSISLNNQQCSSLPSNFKLESSTE